jgi:uncharacterized protein YegP (UPF0339 family)
MVMETKFTPGPWKLAGETVYALNDAGHNRFQALVSQGWAGTHTRTELTEIYANAQLMVASPEMYEALQNSQQAIREMRSNGDPTAWWDDIEKANIAAIAKAEGR